MKSIMVAVDKPYEVFVGKGLLKEIAKSVPENVNQIAIIFAPIMEPKARNLVSEIQKILPDIKIHLLAAPDSESAKTVKFLELAWNLLGQNKFTRSDLIISIGGGATTDVAGFIAASWLRGIEIIHLPTTLLAMVDASVGGKTGINTESGKNLVGAFHHPFSVWCDLLDLETLPQEDLRAGFAEVIKCGFIADTKIIELVELSGKDILNIENPNLLEAIERAISVKANVVAKDFKENQIGGLGREVLNYGHTLGHAIENIENYKWRHGDAISVGMMFAAHLAFKTGNCSDDLVFRQQHVFDQLGLSTVYEGSFEELLDVMAIDKKSRGNKLRFIGLKDFGEPVVIAAPNVEDLEWAFAKLAVAR